MRYFLQGLVKAAALPQTAFPLVQRLRCQRHREFLWPNEINSVHQASPPGRDYSPGNERNSLTRVHVRKSRVCVQGAGFGSAVTPCRASPAHGGTCRAGDENANDRDFPGCQTFVFAAFCISWNANTAEKMMLCI